MWGVLQSGISELDFDFAGYAAKHFDRMKRTSADAVSSATWGRNPHFHVDAGFATCLKPAFDGGCGSSPQFGQDL
jgi:hypothetical protein